MAEPAISALESAVLEANAIALGISVESLMENAGRAVAEEAVRHLPPPPARIAIVAGTGNNGGDGTSAAHYLQQWGYAPEVWMVRAAAEIRSPAARHAFDRIRSRLPVHSEPPSAAALAPFPLLIDAMLGTGLRGALRPPYDAAARAMNESGAPILAIDVPSGEGNPGAVRATVTVALTAPKEGVPPQQSGKVVVREIGIPPRARDETGPGEFHFFPLPGPGGRSARVAILGGGPYAGAPALAGLAALRAGAERATVICPAAIASDVRAYSPALVVEPVGSDRFRTEDFRRVTERLGSMRFQAVAFGMGVGRDPSTVELFRRLLAALPPEVPCLVDADALEAVTVGVEARPPGRPVLLTPNPGELLRLAGRRGELSEAERVALARELAERHRVTLLAKGPADVLASPTRTLLNRHHHPAGSVSGAGDVLDGVAVALLAGGVEPLAAARLASYWVGDAGVRGFGRRSYGLLATDILEELPVSLGDGLRRLGR